MNDTDIRRVRVIRLSLPMLANLLKDGRCWQVTADALPDDAVVLATWFDRMRDCWCLKVHSASYRPAWPGDVYEIAPTPIVTELTLTAPVPQIRTLV